MHSVCTNYAACNMQYATMATGVYAIESRIIKKNPGLWIESDAPPTLPKNGNDSIYPVPNKYMHAEQYQ